MLIPTYQVIRTHAGTFGNNYTICKAILEDRHINFVEYVDGKEAIRKALGRINPSNGFVIVTPHGEVVTDYFQLVLYLDKKGLKNLA